MTTDNKGDNLTPPPPPEENSPHAEFHPEPDDYNAGDAPPESFPAKAGTHSDSGLESDSRLESDSDSRPDSESFPAKAGTHSDSDPVPESDPDPRPDKFAPRGDKLHKVLASCGAGSRREMEIAIAEARVLINGVPAKIGARVFPEDELRLDGEVVARRPQRRRTLLYYKPRGEVVTRADGEGAPTIFERLPAPGSGRWINVGRLDLDSEGLILVTTDGEWAERLSHPRNGFEREYLARVYGELSDDAIAQVCAGVEVDGKPLTPLAFERRAVGGKGRNRWYRVVLGEGRNRAVRRLFAALGCEVSRLLRVRFGPYVLPRDLRPGEWREAPPLPDFGESDNAQAGWETRGQRDFHSRPPRDFRDRDSRDSRSFRDNRDFRDRDSRPFRNNRDFRDRDSRDSRPFRDNRNFRDRDAIIPERTRVAVAEVSVSLATAIPPRPVSPATIAATVSLATATSATVIPAPLSVPASPATTVEIVTNAANGEAATVATSATIAAVSARAETSAPATSATTAPPEISATIETDATSATTAKTATAGKPPPPRDFRDAPPATTTGAPATATTTRTVPASSANPRADVGSAKTPPLRNQRRRMSAARRNGLVTKPTTESASTTPQEPASRESGG